MSHSDSLAAVEVLIAAMSLCAACVVAKSGLPARDVGTALRVLIRTRSAELVEACDSYRSARPAFRATI
jgi:hypothetical protein